MAVGCRVEGRCLLVPVPGSYLRLVDSFITQLKAQGPSRTCNESKEEEEEEVPVSVAARPEMVTTEVASRSTSVVSVTCAREPIHRNVKRFRGGLLSKAQRLLYHSTLGSRVIKKKKKSPARESPF